MEQYKSIDEYVATEMSDKVVKRAQSPVVGLLLFVVGLALLALMRHLHLADSLQAAVLTVGIIALGLGLVLTAMTLSKALWHYCYLPTRSKMKSIKRYLDVADYARCLEGLREGSVLPLRSAKPIVSSNSALAILYSRDQAFAIVQAGRYDTGHFEPESAPLPVFGTEIAAIQELCK